MSCEIQKQESNPFAYSEDKIALLKNTVCKGASDSELQLFLHVCIKTGLDPFMKQIYSIPRAGTRTIQTSIDGLRLIAERSGRYAPGKEACYVYDASNNLLSATAFVKKMTTDGTWHDVSATVFFSEFNPGNNPFWKKMPHVMLAKCGEASALRKAFPAEMSGIYSDDEMDQAPATTLKIEELPKPEDSKEAEDKLSYFVSLYPPEDEEMIRSYLKKYGAHWKKGIIQSLEDYNDPSKFQTDFSKWKAREIARLQSST